MAIRVLSFDFDGCLFHPKYIKTGDQKIIEHNKALFDKIKEENKNYTKVYSMVGSNRQSYSIDMTNQIKPGWPLTGSCFSAIKTISDYLGAILQPFLMADLYGNLPDGTSLERAIKADYKGEHQEWLFDDTKVTILYAQMHLIAMKHPHEEIIFDFYDDREDILRDISVFYSKPENKHLIPPNVNLRLNKYDGNNLTQYAQIKGTTGFIDINFRYTVKEMAEHSCVNSSDGRRKPLYVARHAKVDKLMHRKAFIPADGLSIVVKPNELQTADTKQAKPIVPEQTQENSSPDSLPEQNSMMFMK